MKLTNETGLPEAIVAAITEGDNAYKSSHGKRSDISVTRLIDSPQVARLTKQHWEELEEDAADRIWSLLGRLVHKILEDAGSSELKEQRLYHEYAGYVVSGQFDALDVSGGILRDYKLCSVWEYIYGVKQSRVNQLNVLADLCRENGYTVNKLEVVMIFRDWKKTEAQRNANYPQQQVAIVPIELYDADHVKEYIKERLFLHMSGTDSLCSMEERWYQAGKIALMKEGRKTAIKLFDNHDEAVQYCASNGYLKDAGDGIIAHSMTKGHSLVERRGVNRRCEDYCAVAQFCPQWQQIQNEGVNEDE